MIHLSEKSWLLPDTGMRLPFLPANILVYLLGQNETLFYDFATPTTTITHNYDTTAHTSTCDEVQVYYYGYRYYSPELGRWVSRDPMGEGVGGNLYMFAMNSCSFYSDFLGLDPVNINGWDFMDNPLDYLSDLFGNDVNVVFGDPGQEISTERLLALGDMVINGLSECCPEAKSDFEWWLKRTGNKSDFDNVMESWSTDEDFLKDQFDVPRVIMAYKCEKIPAWRTCSCQTEHLSRRIRLYLGRYKIKYKAQKIEACKIKATFRVEDKYDFSENAQASYSEGRYTVRIHDEVWLRLQSRGEDYADDFDRVAEWTEEIDCLCAQEELQ